MIRNILVDESKNYLSEVLDVLPSHVMLNKGMTGCGGTTLELTSKRNSIILVPTVNLVENKSRDKNVFGFSSMVSDEELYKYIHDDSIEYKKIVATYDSIIKFAYLGSLFDYFLLIDEYHTLFVHYKFRTQVIMYLLHIYKQWKNWCFMSATPLNSFNILSELKGIDIVNVQWEGKAKLKLKLSPTSKPLPLLEQRIYECLNSDYNLHIFFNSFKSIKKVVDKFNKLDYRVVCSASRSDKQTLNFQSINSPVKKINFYTATAHDGCDIFDTKGKTIIISDDILVSTMMDISIHIVQISGRVRNSMFIDKIEWIFSSHKHRYFERTDIDWMLFVDDNIKNGNNVLDIYNKTDSTPQFDDKGRRFNSERETYLKSLDYNVIMGYYINSKEDIKTQKKIELFYDENLKMCDFENNRLFRALHTLYVQNPKIELDADYDKEIKVTYKTDIEEKAYKVLLKGKEYTREELSDIFFSANIIDKPKISYNFITDNFSSYSSRIRKTNGIKNTVYVFY